MGLFGNRPDNETKRQTPKPAFDALLPLLPQPLGGKYLVFELAGEFYGLLLKRVQEVVAVEELDAPTSMPDYALGRLDLRGQPIPVVDLRRKLHVRAKRLDAKSSIVVAHVTPLGGKMHAVGFLVDAIEDVLLVAPDTIQETPYLARDGQPGEFPGIARVGEGKFKRTITLIHPDPLLSARDLARMTR
ncbi:MAG TPA: chemotaxis protein CheW [Candidatus Methylacidiphilales bacterium]